MALPSSPAKVATERTAGKEWVALRVALFPTATMGGYNSTTSSLSTWPYIEGKVILVVSACAGMPWVYTRDLSVRRLNDYCNSSSPK